MHRVNTVVLLRRVLAQWCTGWILWPYSGRYEYFNSNHNTFFKIQHLIKESRNLHFLSQMIVFFKKNLSGIHSIIISRNSFLKISVFVKCILAHILIKQRTAPRYDHDWDVSFSSIRNIHGTSDLLQLITRWGFACVIYFSLTPR